MWMSCELTTPKLDHASQDKIIRTKNRLRKDSGDFFTCAYGIACLFLCSLCQKVEVVECIGAKSSFAEFLSWS
jgi:hypothetical protein